MSETKLPQSAFRDASLKLQRACQHINQLIALVNHLQNSDAAKLVVSHNSDGSYVAGTEALGAEGLMIPLLVGDAVHNLRCALDHAWSALSRAANPAKQSVSAVDFATFPFHETRKNVQAAVDKGPIKNRFPTSEDVILNKIKPYADAGGDRILWALTKLDKIDKHRLLITIAKADRFERLTITNGKGGRIEFENVTFQNVTAPIAGLGTLKTQGEVMSTIEIRFGQTMPVVAGQMVIETLTYLAEAVDKTLKLFRQTFC